MKKIIFIWDGNSIHLKKWISFFVNDFKISIISDTKLNDESVDFWKDKQIKVYDFNINWNIILKILNLIRKFFIYNLLVLKYKNSILNYHYISLSILLTFPSLLLTKNKIATFWWSDYNLAKWIQKIIIKLVSKTFNIITSDTQEILDWLKNTYKINEKKLIYINHWVNSKIFTHVKKQNIEKDFIIFSPRALNKFYNHHILWNNIDKIIKLFWKDIKLVFIKYNFDKNYFNNLLKIQNKYPNNIQILEQLSQQELTNEYQKSHLVISIPEKDWLPVTLIESIFTETPVLWINTIDYKSLLPEKYLLNQPINEEHLLNKIKDIYNNYNKVLEEIRTMKEKNIEKYDYEYNMKKMKKIYLELTK